MQKRRHQRRVHHARGLLQGPWRLLLPVLAGAALLLLLILLLRPSSQLLNTPEIARAQRLGVLRVGVRSDVPGFSQDGDGLEVAIARKVAERIFPDMDSSVTLELINVTAYTALPKLASGDIDLAFALQRNTGDSAYTFSGTYYTDSVRLLCRPGSEATALSAQHVGLIEGSEAEAAWKAYNTKNDTALTATYFASYPDLVTGLLAGRVDFIAVPGVHIAQMLQSGVALHGAPLGKVNYVAASSAESPAFALFADLTLQEMQRNGELDALIGYYGLSEYRAPD